MEPLQLGPIGHVQAQGGQGGVAAGEGLEVGAGIGALDGDDGEPDV